jgi:hypothetical protein
LSLTRWAETLGSSANTLVVFSKFNWSTHRFPYACLVTTSAMSPSRLCSDRNRNLSLPGSPAVTGDYPLET